MLDCTFAEFERSLEGAEVIEEHMVSGPQVKEVVLAVDWTRPLHVVVVVDDFNLNGTVRYSAKRGEHPEIPLVIRTPGVGDRRRPRGVRR